MLGHDDPTMIRMMEDMTGVDAKTIPLDDKKTMSIFTSSKVLGYENDKILGPTGAVAVPEFNTRFTRGVLLDTMPEYLHAFDCDIFGDIVEKIIAGRDNTLRFRLTNGLELTERIEKVVR